MLTKKDYIVIADAINNCMYGKIGNHVILRRDELLDSLCVHLGCNNANFDCKKFRNYIETK